MNLPLSIDKSLLSQEQLTVITALAPELSQALSVRQLFRTETEARISVLDDVHYPTPAAKYWQCNREQVVMLEQLTGLSFEFQRNAVAIKRLLQTLDSEADPLLREDAQINLQECYFKQANMQAVAADRAREIALWSMLKQELNDGSFDTDNVNSHQLISYTLRFIKQVTHATAVHMSQGEMDNLAGQLQTALKRCRQLGVLDELKAYLPEQIINDLKLEQL